MDLIFRGLQWQTILVYLDDIIVISENYHQHLERLQTVLERLREAGLKIKPSKCELFQPEVLFLGHIVSESGIRPNPKTVEAVQDWKEPTNVKEIQRFLGLCGYYRQYVPHFSHLAAPLTRLTKKDTPFEWDSHCQTAFEELKRCLCTSPILAYPQQDGEFILDTDASDVGIGGVLSQIQDGKERVIAYISKRLSRPQENYSVTRRELLAVIYCTDKFRHHLLGKKFKLRTDHGSLRWLFEFKNPKGQVARWLEQMAQYDFTIEHRQGTKHSNADSLSRRDYEENTCDHPEDDNSCEQCMLTAKEWKQFQEDVDDVVDIGVPVQREIRQISSDNPTPLQVDASTSYLPCYTPEAISKLQREDDSLSKLHDWMDTDDLPSREEAAALDPATRKLWIEYQSLTRQNGVIYRKKWLTTEKKRHELQLLVPAALKDEIMRDNHDVPHAGHFGSNKTITRIRKKFYWYHMDQDIRIHVRSCDKCNRYKLPQRQARAKQRPYTVGYPLDRVGIDIMGPLPETKTGMKYILVIGDYFTRYMEAYCLPNQKAEEVAKKLVQEFIARYGAPLELHSDQGRNFESDLFKEVLRLFQIQKTRTTPYRPSSNGLVEQFNGTLVRMIEKVVNRNLNDWDQHIGLLLAAYRSTEHPATGYSPNMLMFGREVNLPSHLLFPIPKQEQPPDVNEYISNLRQTCNDCFEVAREGLKEAAARQQRDHDTRVLEHKYRPGDAVYKRLGPSKKLKAKYAGPYIVSKELNPAVYEIINKKDKLVVHHDRLKTYESDLPGWAKNLQEKFKQPG